MRNERVRIVVEIGLTIALTAVLGMLKVWEMPQGGSVSLGMLPLFVLALRRGVPVGILAGALYGVVDYFIGPYFVHWAQVLLDYPVAYAGVGLAGIGAHAWRRAIDTGTMTRKVWTIALPSIALGAAARYAAHVLSGVIFFAEFAGDQPVLLYSAIYNVYVPISAVLCYVAAALVLPVLGRVVDQPHDAAPIAT